MYTIFKKDTSIILTDNLENKEELNFFYWEEINFLELLSISSKKGLKEIILYHGELEFAWKEFVNLFFVIEAAGGVVQNSSEEILFILRNDKWDLPKGKIELNENVNEAAIREVQEECGIVDVTIKNFIGKTYHIFSKGDQEVLKVSHWFKMFSDDKRLTPQFEEDITKVEWKNKIEIEIALKNTYPNIRMLMENI